LGDVVPAGWTESGSMGVSNATIVSHNGGRGYQFVLSGSTNLNSAVEITNASSASFSMSVTFMITSMATNPALFSNINLFAFSDTSDGGSGYRLGYNIGPSGG